MTVEEITGDSTGLIEIESGIRFLIAEKEDRTNIFSNIRIRDNGELVTAPNLYIYETFDVMGELYGTENLYLSVMTLFWNFNTITVPPMSGEKPLKVNRRFLESLF